MMLLRARPPDRAPLRIVAKTTFTGTDGSRPELADDPHVDEPVNRKRVARLMRNNGMVGIHLRKPKTTTISDPDAQVFADAVVGDLGQLQPGEGRRRR